VSIAGDGVLILTGPTASGKTSLALTLAEDYDAEIVGADSRQIYRDMAIGTAAPAVADLARVPHHLIAFLDPGERYSAARYVVDARAAIDAIRARGRRAIVVGGTGFYVRALAGDVALDAAHDGTVRARLAREARTHPPEVLAAWLGALAPERARAIDAHDPYRITRALEIALASRRAQPAPRGPLPTLRAGGIPYLKLWLECDPAVLAARIAQRVDAMLAAGLVAEAERIGLDAVAADAVGYREALAYASGWSTAAELRAQLIRATRRYAKRQATWFRTEPDLVRVAADDVSTMARQRLGWTKAPR
jgi:tRNA dimethylallyltransferase